MTRHILIWTNIATGREVARDVFAAHSDAQVASHRLNQMRANPHLDCRHVEEPNHG